MAASRKIAFSTKFFYGVGSIANGVNSNTFSYFMLFFYSQVVGVEGYLVGIAMLVMMLADAFSDPIIGHVSDNWKSRFGRRHPFMYFSAIPVSICFFLLFVPPTEYGQGVTLAYFIVVAIATRTFVTMFEIPSSSLVPEFTDDYDERTSILSFRYFFGWWGGLTIAILAYKVFFATTEEFQDGRLNPESWVDYGIFGSSIIFVAIMMSSIGTHKEIPFLKKAAESQKFKFENTFKEMLESLSNRNFLVIFVSAVLGAMAGGVNSALVLYFNTFFWEFTSSEIGTLNLAYYFSAITALVLAPRVTRNREKQHVAVVVYLAGALLLPLPIVLRLFGVFIPNDSEWLLPVLMLHGYLDVTIMIMASILISSMIADIVEDSQKTTGRRSEGLFFAGQSFAQKVVHGFGIFATGIILSIINFPKDVGPGEVPQEVLNNLGYLYVPLVVIFYCAAVYTLSRYKITRAIHTENIQSVTEDS
ncbi:MAG: GPH family glycoside/pentoside/hexuronide:cation symporter [Candidatus Azotimanducaceae bacterium]|jgi:GPH family glycoside/pentoside/hexuronide:cation symporter